MFTDALGGVFDLNEREHAVRGGTVFQNIGTERLGSGITGHQSFSSMSRIIRSGSEITDPNNRFHVQDYSRRPVFLDGHNGGFGTISSIRTGDDN